MRSNEPKCCAVIALCIACSFIATASAQQEAPTSIGARMDALAKHIESDVIRWRRDIHQHPELSNREFRTAKIVADHLRSLGLEVRTEVAHTGVVGVLRGARETPVIALRADMDALPVTEALDLPFASKVRTQYNGREVGVMHACGHDAHTAMLMGAAQLLASVREELPGTVKFIFQPAEEGPPAGEDGGASLMIAEGALEQPRPQAIFGLHVFPYNSGEIHYRAGPIMASSDGLTITVRGAQTHGAAPWDGVDPIVVASQIVLGLQTIVSRQMNITDAPVVISIGSIHGGLRSNIIPDEVVLSGTIRSFTPEMRRQLREDIENTAEKIAEAAGATAEVRIGRGGSVVTNDVVLTEKMVPTLKRVAGEEYVRITPPRTVAEDFSSYQREIPGLFFFLGITPVDADPEEVAMNHSPYFYVDETALIIGVRALAHLAADFLAGEAH